MKKFMILILCCLMLSGCTKNTAKTGKPTQPPQTSATTIFNETEPPTSTSQEETSPTELIQMTVYVPDENAISFNVITVEGHMLTFLEAMVEAGVLNEDIQVNSIAREETQLTIDFNQAFLDLINSMGTSGERMIIGSVVNTLIVNYEVETVSITVEGDIWESGHVIYDSPMSFFE
jgi:hypothetical protein